MRLQSLSKLKQLQPIQSIKQLSFKRLEAKETPLNEIELILYSTNLCLYSMRILRNEITVRNREAKLQALMREAAKMHSLLSQRDFYLHSTYTKSNTKKFFKQVGLRPHHLAY